MTSRFYICLIGLATLFGGQNALHAQNNAFGDPPALPQDQGADDTLGGQVPDRANVPEQSIEVNEERAGWQAAGLGITKDRLSDKLRANWVMVDSNGLLRGTVIGFDPDTPVTDVIVYLLNNGRVVNTARVNDQGQFSFNNVQQGTYGLVGFGKENFFAFGFDAIRNSDNPNADAPTSLTVMATPNQTTINTDWIAYFAPDVNFRVYGRFVSKEGTDDPPALYGTDGVSVHYPKAFPATSIQSHAVSALSDGRVIGRVHQIDSLNGRPVDVRNTRIMLLQNDDVYAATSADNFGVFEFTKIEPGFYSLVAAGVDGMATIGLEIVASDGLETLPDGASADAEIVPIDVSLLPSEASGWLFSHANETAYNRAIAASARYNAELRKCNCPPNTPEYAEALRRALTPSKRGRFWKRLNSYFDEIFYGADTGQGGASAPAQLNYGGLQGYPGGYSVPPQGVPYGPAPGAVVQPGVAVPLNNPANGLVPNSN